MAYRNGNNNGNADKAQHAKKLADQALDSLATALEQGRSETLTAYFAAMARFHRYSFGNVMLIASQKPDATHVAGFRTWLQLDRHVKKGEKGIVIIAPMMLKRRDDSSTERPNGHNGDAGETFIRFRAVHVFDVGQTEGEPLPDHASVTGDHRGCTDRLKALVAQRGIALEYSDELGSADGSSYGGRIAIRTGLSPAEEFATLAHEFAHETLHRDTARAKLPNTVRETEAEAVAFVVCQAAGLDTNTAASDYIQLYAGDKATLAASLDRIQQTATTIITAILANDDAASAR